MTEELFSQFERYIGQLDRAADLAGPDAIVSDEITARLRTWASGLVESDIPTRSEIQVPDGFLQIYKPGSIVSVFLNGVIYEREIIEAIHKDFFGTGYKQLFYRYRNPRSDSVDAFAPHDQIQPTGHNWSWILWNPDTGEYRDLEEEITTRSE